MKKGLVWAVFFTMLIVFTSVGAFNVSNSIETNSMIQDSRNRNGDIIDDVGWYTSLALDTNGDPHISYYDYTNSDLKYAFLMGGIWLIETVDSEGEVGRYTSIALDRDNNPHISYYDATNKDLKYAKKTNGVWEIGSVDTFGKVGLYTSITLDTHGYPHISYCHYDLRALKYAFWTGSTWDTSIVDNSGDICCYEYFGDYTSLALDSSGFPHISYCDFGNYDLKYAYQTTSGWSTEVVDADGDVGEYSSLTLDDSDNPHISYGFWMKGNNLFNLKYASKTNGVWNVETVDEDGDVRKWTSLQLDTENNPHISYHDYTEDALKYTYYDGNDWILNTVDSAGSTGCFNSLVLDSHNLPYISYYDWGNKALKYAYIVDDNWAIETIEIDTNTDFLDQQQNYCCGYATEIADEFPLAQGFIPTYPVLTRVELMIVRRYNPGGITVSIRETLEGDDLRSVYHSVDEVPEDMSWKHVNFPDLAVTPGEPYYIVCTTHDTEEYDTFWWYFGIHDAYPGESGWTKTPAGWKVLTSTGFPEMDVGFKTFGLDTSIPSIPVITGPVSGTTGVIYDYEVVSVDDDGDEISYFIDFGDAVTMILGPCPSGSSCVFSHSWSRSGTYEITAKAYDTNGAESDWGTLTVSMPKNKITNPFIGRFQFLARLLNL